MSLAPFLHRVASGESLSSAEAYELRRKHYAPIDRNHAPHLTTEQREFQGEFAYTNFHKFPTSSDVKLRDAP